MKPKTIMIMIIYMLLVYTTTHAFAYNELEIGGNYQSDILSETDYNETQEQINASYNISWIDSIGQFFGTIITAFSYLIGMLTFNVVGNIGNSFSIPSPYNWIPLLMVLPVWLAVTFWLAPYVVKVIEAIGNWIPFT